MKKKGRSGCIYFLILLICFVGWRYASRQNALDEMELDQGIIYVAFSRDGEEGEPMDYREISQYTSKYSAYNSRVMYATLPPAEQQIYRLLEYALDHEYTTIFFDARLLEDVKLTLEDILKLYSMDSAMVQQNYSYSSAKSSYTFSYGSGMTEFELVGSKFTIENFSSQALSKKLAAIEAAKTVFATMPQGLNQLEQARFFFRYLTREVTYSRTEVKPGLQNNLYDAFIEKKTQCDGFSNAFSLLCGMANIPCVEKIVSPKVEGEIGHTWNVFCADGVWYNTDLALTENYAQLHKEMDVDFSFGFPDDRKTEVCDFADRFPPCTADLLPADVIASSPSDPNLLPGVKNAFQTGGKPFVILGLETGKMESDNFKKVANYLRSNIRTIDEERNGKNYYFIFKR